MKTGKIYCSTAEAAVLLGMRPWELQVAVKEGSMRHLAETVISRKRTTLRLLRSEVLKEAGLSAWPSEIDSSSPVRRAELAARDLKATGYTTEQMAEIGEILFRHRVITGPQYKRIGGKSSLQRNTGREGR